MSTEQKLAVIEALIEAKKKPIKDNSEEVKKIAQQAIASMRDAINHNETILSEVIKQIAPKPKEFLIQRDGKGDMVKIIPVYDDGR